MKKHFETFQDFIESLNSKFSAIYLSETYNHSSWQEDWTLGYHSIKFKHIFLSGFSFTDTNDSQNSRGSILFDSTISAYSRIYRHLFDLICLLTLYVR